MTSVRHSPQAPPRHRQEGSRPAGLKRFKQRLILANADLDAGPLENGDERCAARMRATKADSE